MSAPLPLPLRPSAAYLAGTGRPGPVLGRGAGQVAGAGAGRGRAVFCWGFGPLARPLPRLVGTGGGTRVAGATTSSSPAAAAGAPSLLGPRRASLGGRAASASRGIRPGPGPEVEGRRGRRPARPRSAWTGASRPRQPRSATRVRVAPRPARPGRFRSRPPRRRGLDDLASPRGPPPPPRLLLRPPPGPPRGGLPRAGPGRALERHQRAGARRGWGPGRRRRYRAGDHGSSVFRDDDLEFPDVLLGQLPKAHCDHLLPLDMLTLHR